MDAGGVAEVKDSKALGLAGVDMRPMLSKAERKALRQRKRETELQALVTNTVLQSARDVELRRWMFATDEEMTAGGLGPRQIAKVRQWEQSKKKIAFGMEAANLHVMAHMKRQQEKAGITINVESASISLPEKQPDDRAPIYIDVSAEK